MPVPSGFTLIFDSGSSTRFAVTRILRAMTSPDFRVNVVREHYAGARGAAIGKAAALRPGATPASATEAQNRARTTSGGRAAPASAVASRTGTGAPSATARSPGDPRAAIRPPPALW